MCHRFIMIDRSEVVRVAQEIAADLAEHAGELGTLDPLESYRPYLSRPARPEAPPDGEGAGPRDAAGDGEAAASPAANGTRATTGSHGGAEAFPSSVVALIVPTGCGAQLAVADMAWGFDAPWKAGAVFNTRIETALGETAGMWADAIGRRRCVVPARAFFESHASETVPSARTGRPVKRQYAFRNADGSPLLMAGVHERGRFSIVTTAPNETVSRVHGRMPLVLAPGEAALWLAGRYEGLADRSSVHLEAAPER